METLPGDLPGEAELLLAALRLVVGPQIVLGDAFRRRRLVEVPERVEEEAFAPKARANSLSATVACSPPPRMER